MGPAEIRPLLAAMAARAPALDAEARFPAEDIAALAGAGFAMAPLPRALGGAGLGTEPGDAGAVFGVLRLLGGANPSVGRLWEAHVNALRLIRRFGTAAQLEAAARDCREGRFFGLWVTDAPGQALRREGGVLAGAKGPCSGAGHLSRALVTVAEGAQTRMAVVALGGGEAVQPVGDRLLGMRASANGTVRLDGVAAPDGVLVGGDGDYLREPDFSAGAWRTMAVTLGILNALTEAVRVQLRARGHDGAALQQARFGELLIARGTAAHWTWEAARRAEAGSEPAEDQVAAVNLARVAAELAAFEAARHAQRALGLGALVRPNPVERLLRDLLTYLRQPAADAVLTEAAQHALARTALP